MSPYFQKALLFVILLVGAQSSAFAFDVPRTGGKKCALVAHVAADQKSAQTIRQMLVGAENGRIYPRSLPRTEGNHIMFGFESEFTSLQWTQLLSIYMPRVEFGLNKESWQNMPAEDRVTWVKNRAKQMKAGDKDIGLVLMEGAALNGQAVPEFMAKKIILDETGNLEIVQDPVNTIVEFEAQARWITKNIGAGSMQGTVSNLRQSFFAENEQGQRGFFTFTGQLDPLKKLALGGDRYMKDQTKDTAKAFNHPFLGPLTRLKQGHLLQYLHFNREGQFFDQEHKTFIAAQDNSFKYTGMTAYRPDIGGAFRIGTEVRDAHNDVQMLVERVARVTYFHRMGTDSFHAFGNIRSFDSYREFNKMDASLQQMLKTLFPLKKKQGIEYTPAEILAREVFRNFSMPLQDWTPWLQGMNRMSFKADVEKAQATYLERLRLIEEGYSSGKIDQETASRQVQGAIGLFANESQLAALMDAFMAEQIRP